MDYEVLFADIKTLQLARDGCADVATPARVASARARLTLITGLEVVDILLWARENPSGIPEFFVLR